MAGAQRGLLRTIAGTGVRVRLTARLVPAPLILGPGWLFPWLPAGPVSGSGGLGGGVVDVADERLGVGGERLGAAGGAAED